MQEAENRRWTIAKVNQTLDTFLVSTHTQSSELLKISGPLNVYHAHTQSNAQHHQMHDPPWRPQTLAQSLPHTRTHFTYTHMWTEYTVCIHCSNTTSIPCIHIYGRHAFTHLELNICTWDGKCQFTQCAHPLKSAISKCYAGDISIISKSSVASQLNLMGVSFPEISAQLAWKLFLGFLA